MCDSEFDLTFRTFFKSWILIFAYLFWFFKYTLVMAVSKSLENMPFKPAYRRQGLYFWSKFFFFFLFLMIRHNPMIVPVIAKTLVEVILAKVYLIHYTFFNWWLDMFLIVSKHCFVQIWSKWWIFIISFEKFPCLLKVSMNTFTGLLTIKS